MECSLTDSAAGRAAGGGLVTVQLAIALVALTFGTDY